MPSLSQLTEVLSEDVIKVLREEIYNEVLTRKTAMLCKRISPKRHFPLLRQRNVFTLDSEQLIMHEATTTDQVCKFIDELKRVGGTIAFPAFIDSIDKTQIDLKEKLNKCCEELTENVPAELLAKFAPNLNMEDLRRQEAVPIDREVEDRPAEDYPEIDFGKLTDAQETYYRYPTEDQEEDDDDEDKDILKTDQGLIILNEGDEIQEEDEIQVTNMNQL